MRIQEFLRDLSARVSVTTNGDAHAWQIITALRGCDSANHNLKDLTVARLRYVLFGHVSVYTISSQRYPGIRSIKLTPDELKTRDQLLTEAPNHFRLHWQEAVKSVIALYSYDLDTETDIPKGEGESE